MPQRPRPLLPWRRRPRSTAARPDFSATTDAASERDQRLRELAEKAGVLRTTLDHMAQGISVVDAELRLLAWNQHFLDLLGFPENFAREHLAFEEFVRYNAERGEYGPGDIDEQIRTRIALARQFQAHHFKRRRPDGRVIEIRGEPLPGGGFVTTYADITETESVSSALRASEERFRDLAEFSNDWFWEQAADLRFTNVSIGASQLRLFDPQKVIGLHRWDMPIQGVSKEAWAEHRAALERHEIFRDFVYQVPSLSGELRWCAISGKPVFDQDGKFVGYRGTGRDITERRLAEDAVRMLNQTLEQKVEERTLRLEISNRELEAFSYSVSHDLRGPLRSIGGFAQVLRDRFAGQLDPDAKAYLERILAATQRMAQLIDDMLALARITRTPIHCQDVNLTAMAQAIAEELRQQETHAVAFVAAPDLHAWADPILIRVVLENLLRNAWKFTRHTPAARIELSAQNGSEPSAFLVRDNGAGFDMRYAEKLFRPFQRLHLQDQFEGSGIGLATVQRILAQHGGDISVEAAPGRGATFSFRLPGPG